MKTASNKDRREVERPVSGTLSADYAPTSERLGRGNWQVYAATGVAGRITLRDPDALPLDCLAVPEEDRTAGLLLRELYLSAGQEARVTMRYTDKACGRTSSDEIPDAVDEAASLLRRILRTLNPVHRLVLITLCCENHAVHPDRAAAALASLAMLLRDWRRSRDRGLLNVLDRMRG